MVRIALLDVLRLLAQDVGDAFPDKAVEVRLQPAALHPAALHSDLAIAVEQRVVLDPVAEHRRIEIAQLRADPVRQDTSTGHIRRVPGLSLRRIVSAPQPA